MTAGSILSDDLFKRVLLDPVAAGASKLYVVSGYATPAMAFHHVQALRQKKLNVEIELIVGMCAQEGLGESHHFGFKRLVEADLKNSFRCSYLTKPPPVHSKVYAWFKGEKPVAGFVGSANYTQAGFRGGYREAVAPANAEECREYFDSLVAQTIYCDHMDAEQEIVIYNDKTFEYKQRMGHLKADMPGAAKAGIQGLPHAKVSFLDRKGNLPQRSGLNWGQRPELRREPNQAYISLKADVYTTDFFPPIGEHFTIITDDRQVLICTRAQQHAKAIETPHDNSELGRYFRARLGLESGARVTKEHLVEYGRTDLDFYRLDSETYNMDFAPPK